MKYVLIILTAVAGLAAIFKEHGLFSSNFKKLRSFAWFIVLVIVITAAVSIKIQIDDDIESATKQHFIDSTLTAQGRTQTETLDQLTGGKGYAYLLFQVRYDPAKKPFPSEYSLSCFLYTKSNYKLENVAINLRERFKEYGKENVTIKNDRLFGSLKASPSDTLGERQYVMDAINTVPVFEDRRISKNDTVFYFTADIMQFNAKIYQMTILKRIREKKLIESYRWVKATYLESAQLNLKKEIVDEDFPLENGSVNWNMQWNDTSD